MASRGVYKLQFDFAATDSVELSVRKGELVRGLEPPNDGWLNAEVVADSRRRGFVPWSYLKPIDEPSTAVAAPSSTTQQQPPATSSNATGSANNRYSSAANGAGAAASSHIDDDRSPPAAAPSTRLPATGTFQAAAQQSYAHNLEQQHQQQQQAAALLSTKPAAYSAAQQQSEMGIYSTAVSASTAAGGSNGAVTAPPAMMVSSAIPNPAAVVEGFMKNEMYFRQLMKQRQEALTKIEAALGEVMTEVAVCRDRNSQVAKKLKDLDGLVTKERRKWKERADEERVVLAQKSAAPLSSTTIAVSGSDPVSRRL